MATIYSQVKLATAQNIDLGINISTGSTRIDGVLVNSGDRILVKAQTNKTQNGIYAISALGQWLRASDFASGSEQEGGGLVFVTQGDSFADTGWILSTDGAITVGTSNIEFERVTLNLKIKSEDIPSNIVLRSEKGYPLTITELDNNFKFLALTLLEKLDIVDFNSVNIAAKLNELSAQEAALNAFKLRDRDPSISSIPDTVAVRDGQGNLISNNFIGDLDGNANTADLADFATLAGNVTGIVAIANGGTAAQTAAGARNNLRAVNVDGDTLLGKLTFKASAGTASSLNIPSGADPTSPLNGDVWTSNEFIRYRLNGITQTVARLNSPSFTGTPTAPTPDTASDSTTIATTAYVKNVKEELIDPAIALKSNINSPTFTGDPKAPTAQNTNISTTIANTEFTRNYFNLRIQDYYTKLSIDAFLSNIYTKPQIDSFLSNIYTKPQTDTLVSTSISNALTNYYTRAQVDNNIFNATNDKATVSYVNGLQDKWGSSRKFVQSSDPGTAAVDGDFWFKI